VALVLLASDFAWQDFKTERVKVADALKADLESGFQRIRELALESYRTVPAVREIAAFCGGWGEDSIESQNADPQDLDAWALLIMLVIYRHCKPYSKHIQWQGNTLLTDSSQHVAELRNALRGRELSKLFWPTGDEAVTDFEQRFPHLPPDLDEENRSDDGVRIRWREKVGCPEHGSNFALAALLRQQRIRAFRLLA